MELKACESPGKLAHFFLMRSSMFSLAVYLQGDGVFKSSEAFLCTVSSQLYVKRGEKAWGRKAFLTEYILWWLSICFLLLQRFAS